MNVKNYLITSVVSVIIGILIGMLLSSQCSSKNVEPEVVVKWDTLLLEKPVPKDSLIVKRDTIIKKVTDTIKVTESIISYVKGDSIAFDIKRVQKHYSRQDSYDAWVSGVDPTLDSIKVYNKTTTINKRLSGHRAGVFAEGSYSYMKTSVINARAGLHWTIPQGVDFFIDYRIEMTPQINNTYMHGPEAGVRYTFDFLK